MSLIWIPVCSIMHLSRERTIFVCYQFFKQLRNRYGTRKPILTHGALWYNEACRWLMRLPHHVYGTELKNPMERFIQHMKDRLNVSTIIFHAGRRGIAIGSMFGTG
jgi:transposase-like protein